jgi:hypothetical protein
MGRHSLGESQLAGQRGPGQAMPARSMFSADAGGYSYPAGGGMARQHSGLPPAYAPQGSYGDWPGHDDRAGPYDEAGDGQMGGMGPRGGPAGPGPCGGPPPDMGGPGSSRVLGPGAGGMPGQA